MVRVPSDAIRICGLALAALGCAACDDGGSPSPVDEDADGGEPSGYLTASVVFGDVTSSYVAPLRSLDLDEVDLDRALEFPGWADAWVHEGRLYVADGEAPQVTRYDLEDGMLVEGETVAFEGASSAAFWTNMFVAERKAYLFNMDAREVVVWDPESMVIESTFELPELPDRGAQTLQVPSTDRSSVVRGNRAYVPTIWADSEEYDVSDDSVILVIDIERDEVIDTISVDCPNLNFATRDDDGNIYFSNWVFGVLGALTLDKPSTCAVRIPAGSDTLDDWTFRFADVTDGREGAALEYIGDGKLLMSVFHDERVEITDDTSPVDLEGKPDWRYWTLDLDTMEAEPVDALDHNAGGLYGERVDGQLYLLVPSADYGSTTAYVWDEDGEVEEAWRITGWSSRLFEF